MHPPFGPIIFQLGPVSLHWYGLIMVVAILVAVWVASRYLSRHGEDGSKIWDMLLWVLIPALIGERLYYVFIQSPRGPDGLGNYLAHPIEILEIWKGGMHIYGAFIFGSIALVLYARWHKLPVLLYLDAVALALPLGQAIGRWANFINQELYGPPTTLPWGLRIDDSHRVPPYNNLALYPESTRFHPLFLYESLANLVGFVLIFWISRRFAKRLRTGDLLLIYLIWYPLVRFCIEFLRTDSWFFPGTPFNVVHLLSAITIVTAVTLLIVRHRSRPQVAAAQSNGTLAYIEDAATAGVNGHVAAEKTPSSTEAIDVKDAEEGDIRAEANSNEAGEDIHAEPSNTVADGAEVDDSDEDTDKFARVKPDNLKTEN